MTDMRNPLQGSDDNRFGNEVPHNRLGKSGLFVPAFGLGGTGIGSDFYVPNDEIAIKTIHFALEQGINYFDTSPMYGQSERRLGLALQGIPRDRYIISTKTGGHPERLGDYTWDGTMWCVENSLKTLKIDSIDLLLVHDPDRFSRDGMNSVIKRRGALEALERLKEQGVIKSIGLGQRRHDFHRVAIESGRFDAILIYDDYHPLNQSAGDWLLTLAEDYDVGVLNGSPMSHGLLCGPDPDGINQNQIFDCTPEKIKAAKRFYLWCQEQNVSMGAVIFQLCLRESLIHCTLSGASTRSELEQNLQFATTPLPEEIWVKLANANLTSWRAS